MNLPAHAERRRRLADLLRQAGGGVAIVPTAPEQRRNSDCDYPFRHDSYFHYLTGFDEPGAWLVLDSTGKSTLFCRARDPEREIWDGLRLGPEAAPCELGVDAAFAVDILDSGLPDLLANQPSVWTLFGHGHGFGARLDEWLGRVRQHSHNGARPPSSQHDLRTLLDEMRLIKDAGEIATMRQAAQISAAAHRRAMRYSAEVLRAEPGAAIPEHRLEAELLHEFRCRGAQSVAYNSVVAAGANACVLHHSVTSAPLRAGDLCLIDAGCELDGYASDITRTWPANGRFSSAQRELYDIVLAAQEAAIAQIRPGARNSDSHWAAVRVLSSGLLDTGLLSRDKHGSVDDVIESSAYLRFYMHATGHWLGRDVHDVGETRSLGEAPVDEPDGRGGRITRPPSRRLQPGMLLTVEPGLYVRAAPDIPERYANIGIRIEDDALVTADGCELLSRGVPVTAPDIEALMR